MIRLAGEEREAQMRYTGLKKGNMEFHLQAMAFNLKKAALMVR
jgi:IS5 family transposase